MVRQQREIASWQFFLCIHPRVELRQGRIWPVHGKHDIHSVKMLKMGLLGVGKRRLRATPGCVRKGEEESTVTERPESARPGEWEPREMKCVGGGNICKWNGAIPASLVVRETNTPGRKNGLASRPSCQRELTSQDDPTGQDRMGGLHLCRQNAVCCNSKFPPVSPRWMMFLSVHPGAEPAPPVQPLSSTAQF